MRLGIALSVCLLLHFMSYGLMMWAETIRSLVLLGHKM